MIKMMNSKMTTSSQLSITEPKKKKKQMKQTTRIGTESQKWRSYGWMVISREGEGENGGTSTGNKKNKW